MPAASDYTDRILSHPDDIFGALALRVTARALPQIVVPASIQSVLRDQGELFYLDLFRTILLCCSIQSNISPQVAISIAEKYSKLSKYYTYSMGIVAFRACLRLNLPIPRTEKIEELRRCTQSAYDVTANRYIGQGSGITTDFWDRFEAHLASLEAGTPLTERALEPDDSFSGRWWSRLSRTLTSRNESWKIWTEWFEFRFMGRAGENVPSFLWGEIEAKFISDEQRFNTDDVTGCNHYFAECALEIVEKFADFQSKAQQISGGLQFEIGEDQQIRLSTEVDQYHTTNSAQQSSTVVDEVLNLVAKMKIECRLNSATYLTESIDSYGDAFVDGTWKDPAKVVVRGDALRMLLHAQMTRNSGSDLPELQDRTLLVFRNLVRAHNLLVNIYQELSTIDAGLSSNTINRSHDAVSGLRKIVKYADTKLALSRKAKTSLEAIIALDSSKDEADKLKIGITIVNFTQATFSYMWKNKLSLGAKAATAASIGYGLAQWALANEAWILNLFSVNSQVGTLVRATFRILHQLPVL